MTVLRRLLLVVIAGLLFATAARADEAALRGIIAKLATAKGFPAIEAIVRELGATGDPTVERPLLALSEGDLYFRKSDAAVFIGRERGQTVALSDPITGEAAGEAAKSEVTKVRVNNSLRRSIRDMIGSLTLGSEDPAARLAAAQTFYRTPDAGAIEALDAAIAKEQVASVKIALEQARASSVLVSDLPDDEKLAAIGLLERTGGRDALSLLTAFAARADGPMKEAADAAVENINATLSLIHI